MEGVKKVFNDIPKPLRDDRLYRGLELNNNMKVLVISDPLTDKSAAALDVHVGKIFNTNTVFNFNEKKMLDVIIVE